MKKLYKRLGDYIAPYLEKNVGLKVQLSQGINNNKYFQTPRQVAVDSENDQIVRTGQFAYNKATTRNGEKISIAYREGPDCTVSSAYQVFYIIDEEKLNPYYLLMWFKRPEFDRYARFKSFGSAHEFFTWDEMCNVYLPIPEIAEQQKIVNEYHAIEERIQSNNRLISSLDNAAQKIYYHTFLENIVQENLPSGWKVTNIETYFDKVTIGKTPPRENYECFRTDGTGFKWVSISDMRNANPYVFETAESLTSEAVEAYNIKIIPKNTILLSFKLTVGRVAITTEDMCTNEAIAHFVCKNRVQLCYTYYYLRNFDYNKIGNTSSISEAVNSKIVKKMRFIIPDDDRLIYFESHVSPILDNILQINKENVLLKKILNLLLSKLS